MKLFGRMQCSRSSLGFVHTERPCEEAYLVDGEWMVDIPDGPALQAFCLKYGRVVIDVEDRPVPSLEIYDDMRE